jgi:uncharacterized oligopeptide transporter (OPT) family protein
LARNRVSRPSRTSSAPPRVRAQRPRSSSTSSTHGDLAQIGGDRLPLPNVAVWKGLAVALNSGLAAIPITARWAALAGAIIGIVLEALHARSVAATKRPFPISAIGMSLGFFVPFNASATIALGAILFWVAGKLAVAGNGWRGLLDRVITQDEGGMTLASGLIAGAGLMGIIILCM